MNRVKKVLARKKQEKIMPAIGPEYNEFSPFLHKCTHFLTLCVPGTYWI